VTSTSRPFSLLLILLPPRSTLFPYTTLFRSDKEDYTSFITINDGVHTNNINFLLACYTLLGETRALEPLQRAMTCVLALQGGKRSEEHTSELQSRFDLVCRLLLEKKKHKMMT